MRATKWVWHAIQAFSTVHWLYTIVIPLSFAAISWAIVAASDLPLVSRAMLSAAVATFALGSVSAVWKWYEIRGPETPSIAASNGGGGGGGGVTTGPINVTSHGQSGGITAGVVHLGAERRVDEIGSTKPVVGEDGRVTRVVELKVQNVDDLRVIAKGADTVDFATASGVLTGISLGTVNGSPFVACSSPPRRLSVKVTATSIQGVSSLSYWAR